jgi:hypothetical protein
MAITVDIVGVGPVEFPDGMSKEAMESALKKLPSPTKAPPPTAVVPSNQSNYVTGDVPSVVGQYVRPTINQPEPQTSMMDKVKALYEVPATIGSGIISQPASMLYGLGRESANAISEGRMPSPEARDAYYRQARQNTQFLPNSPTSVKVLESIGDTLEASKLPPYMGKVGIGQIPSFTQAAKAASPFLKEAASTAIQNVQPAVNTMANALRTVDFAPKGIVAAAPSAENLASEANRLFEKSRQANIVFKPEQFTQKMTDIGSELRNQGYTPAAYPKITGVLSELQNATRPKDFVELQALRKIISGAQASIDPTERRLASILKSNFDDYVANAPESAISSGTKQGIATWKEARDVYSKLSKSEVFTDMFRKAELDKNGIGVQKSLTNQLRSLAKSDKKMRLFTVDEQEAIKQAAKGGNLQNILSGIGKFAPTSAVSSIPSILATAASAPLGLAATAGAIGSKMVATKMKKGDIEKLAALMRSGAKPTKKVKGKENE